MGSCEPIVMLVREYKIAVQDEDYRYIMTDCVDAGQYTLYVAGYDIGGRLVEILSKTFDFARGRAVYDMEKDLEDYYDIKIMLWDDMKPLCRFYQK